MEMENLQYEFNNCLDISRWIEPSKLKEKETPKNETLRHVDTCDSGFQSFADQSEMQMRVDSFRKLGYSPEEIYSVLQNLGIDADTNAVLGELVKHGVNPEREAVPEETTDPTLVSRGVPGTRSTTSLTEESDSNNLRPIVIDGSNVAMSHGNKEVFSCRGILLAVTFFLEKGHTDITVFVPSWRKEQPRPDMPITDQHILTELEKKKIMVFTPSRRVGGKRLVCYDDRFIVKLAYKCDGIIVSNDTYRDLQSEKPEWKKFIEERLLMYSFVNDIFMPPDDPMGRKGPNLDDFLRKRPLGPENKKLQCPYGKKCTYGMKCKFYHPERINQTQRSVADELRENARLSPTKTNSYLEDKKSRKHSVVETSSVDAGTSSLQTLTWERTGSSQKARAIEEYKKTFNQFYPNGASKWFHPSVSSKDSLTHNSYDSGLELWKSMSNSFCETSHEPAQYCSCSQQIPCCHRRDMDANRCSHFSSQKMVSRGPHSAPYFPYNPSSQNMSHHMYGAPMSDPGPNVPRSLPADYPAQASHSLDIWTDPNAIHHPSASSQSNYQGYIPVQHPSSDYHQWQNQEQYTTDRLNLRNQEQYTTDRLNLRTKLCAIFNPQLVDAVMKLHPHQMDPQALAAEMFNYKSQRRM